MGEKLLRVVRVEGDDEVVLAEVPVTGADAFHIDESGYHIVVSVVDQGLMPSDDPVDPAMVPEVPAPEEVQVSTSDTAAEGALSEETFEELYERAKALDIPGRSSMSKAELQEALALVELGASQEA